MPLLGPTRLGPDHRPGRSQQTEHRDHVDHRSSPPRAARTLSAQRYRDARNACRSSATGRSIPQRCDRTGPHHRYGRRRAHGCDHLDGNRDRNHDPSRPAPVSADRPLPPIPLPEQADRPNSGPIRALLRLTKLARGARSSATKRLRNRQPTWTCAWWCARWRLRRWGHPVYQPTVARPSTPLDGAAQHRASRAAARRRRPARTACPRRPAPRGCIPAGSPARTRWSQSRPAASRPGGSRLARDRARFHRFDAEDPAPATPARFRK